MLATCNYRVEVTAWVLGFRIQRSVLTMARLHLWRANCWVVSPDAARHRLERFLGCLNAELRPADGLGSEVFGVWGMRQIP